MTGDAIEDTSQHLVAVNAVGYTIVENAIELDLIDEIAVRLEELEAEVGAVPATNRFEGLRTTRVYNLLAHGPLFAQIPVHPRILPICEGVLDAGLLVSSLSSIAIGPDEQAQPIHADDQVIALPKPHPAVVCNTMWALTDFTEENGATRVIPRSHLADASPEYLHEYESIPAEMARGSVLVWHGSLWHGGGANQTDRRRVGVAMNYCAGYIRQQENQQLGLPLELVATFSDRLRELIGFGVYRGLIGHVDKRSPTQHLLLDSGDGGMLWDRAPASP